MKLDKNFEIFLEGVNKKDIFENLNFDSVCTLQTIHKLAIKHHRLCENDCNGLYQNEYEFEKTIKKTEEKIKIEFEKLKRDINKNLVLKFQYDPRGWTVKIGITDGLYPMLYPFNNF